MSMRKCGSDQHKAVAGTIGASVSSSLQARCSPLWPQQKGGCTNNKRLKAQQSVLHIVKPDQHMQQME
jgi:hypothetical protein